MRMLFAIDKMHWAKFGRQFRAASTLMVSDALRHVVGLADIERIV
jgi:hypothetical protein